MKLYVNIRELEALSRGVVPATIVEKAKAKLPIDEPIPGQTTLYDHLGEPCPTNSARC